VHLSDETVQETAHAVQSNLGFESPFEYDFFSRVFDTPHSVYRRRLECIGMTNSDRVLDAGCGFGQWSFALAESNRHTVSLEISAFRCSVLNHLSRNLGITTISTLVGDMDDLPFQNEFFDSVYCYGAIMFDDWKRKTSELVRVLRPGGRLYISTSAIGWYLSNLVWGHNDSDDFSSRLMALDTIVHSITTRSSQRGSSSRQSIIQPRSLRSTLTQAGATVLQIAPDGRVGDMGGGRTDQPRQFFAPKGFGLTSVYEVLATK
jgi:ubiquinone/menaquinone biosynthesis C-methylase UbiE